LNPEPGTDHFIYEKIYTPVRVLWPAPHVVVKKIL